MKSSPQTIAIVSGGKGEDEPISEAKAMKKGLVSEGIEKDRILLETRSRTTYQNIKFSKKLVPKNSTVVCVTNGFHVYRAVKMAEKLGLKVHGLSARTPFSTIPKSYLREYLAIAKYKLTGRL